MAPDDNAGQGLAWYSYRRAEDRERPCGRVEKAAMNRLRNAVAALQKHISAASLEQEMTLAIEHHAASLEQRFNGGRPFPEREGDLKPGRRGGGIHKKPKVEPPLLHLVEDLT